MRLLHEMYARLFGYFWLPCPVCGRWFGGHEVRGENGWWTDAHGKSWCVCCKACGTTSMPDSQP
jgi:hypothetical protein